MAYVATREALAIVDLGSGTVEESFATVADNQAHGHIAVHPDLPIVYLVAHDGVAIFDLAAGRITKTIAVDNANSSSSSRLRLTPDAKHLYFSSGYFVHAIDTIAERSVASLSLGDEIIDLELTADGDTLYAVTDTGRLMALSAEHLEDQFDVRVPLQPEDMAVDLDVDLDGTRVIVSIPTRSAVDFLRATDGRYEGSLVIEGRPGTIAFSSDTRRAYVGIDDAGQSYIGVIDTEERSLLDRIPVPFGLREIVVLPDGALLLVGRGGSESCHMLVLDPATREVTRSIDLSGVIDVQLGARPALSPPLPTPTPKTGAGRLCAYLSHGSSEVTVVDLEARSVVGVIPATDSITLFAGSDATRVYASGGGPLTPIDTQSGRALLPIPILGGSPWRMARVPGTDVAVATLRSDCSRVAAIDLVDGSQTTLVAADPSAAGPFWTDDGLFSIAVDPQGRFAYAVSSAPQRNEVKVIAWPSGAIIETISFSGYRPSAVAIHPSRPLAYVTAFRLSEGESGLPHGDRPGVVYTIDTSAHTVIDQVPTDGAPFGIAISPDGSVVYVANANSDRVDALDTASGVVRASIYVDNPVSVAFAPDQSVALVSGHPVAIIDPLTDTVIDTLPTERFAQDILIVEVPGGCVAPPPVCAGDCDQDGVVNVAEVIQALSITFDGSLLQSCESADVDDNRWVTVDEVMLVMNHALSGCPVPSL